MIPEVAKKGKLGQQATCINCFEKPASGPYGLLIYYWRGTHNFLCP